MNSSDNNDATHFPFAADAGVSFPTFHRTDPVGAWLALMEVVEALCPHWPERPVSIGHDYRL